MPKANGQKILLEITVITTTGSGLPLNKRTGWVLGRNYVTLGSSYATQTYAISTTGAISSWTNAGQGGCCGTVRKEDLNKLRRLIRNLPDDHSYLPPIGHRLVLQVPKGTGVLARVYDRANMPERVLEILRMTGLRIHPLVPDFQPDKKWPKAEWADAGISPDAIGFLAPNDSIALAVSPDRSLVVREFLYHASTTQIVDSKTLKVVYKINHHPIGRQTIGDYQAWFTPDGRFLLLLSNRPAMHIYDTRTWQELDRLPGMPSGEAAYYPSSDWARGVAVWLKPGRGSAWWCCGGSWEGAQVVASRASEAWLWDARAHRKLAKLHLGGGIQNVSFSPDNSLVAVTSLSPRQNKDQPPTLIFHLRLWETKTGKFVHELFPPEHFAEIGDAVWSKDGKYLLAPVIEMDDRCLVGIWNVQSGRYRGNFVGCTYNDDLSSILLQGPSLFIHCRFGALNRWDVAAAINRIKAFENTLKPPAASARCRAASKEH